MKKLLFLIIFIVSSVSCSVALNHPLLSADSIGALSSVASKYALAGCKNVGVYPGYNVEFENYSFSDVTHGFGGFVGGCGEFVKINCFYNSSNTNDNSGEENIVKCEEVGYLKEVSK